MSHKVRLTSETYDAIAEISDFIAQDSPTNARRWRLALLERLRSLRQFPERHEIAYPSAAVGRDIRNTFFGSYRVLYAIEGDKVVVLTVRHGARKPLTFAEVRNLG
jgi:plasmid stabilization system protein ParE